MKEAADTAVPVTGQPHEHPAIRRLARACIALARFQRRQTKVEPALPPADEAQPEQQHG